MKKKTKLKHGTKTTIDLGHILLFTFTVVESKKSQLYVR